MRVIKGKHCGLWAAIDVLYYSCPLCGMHVPWAKYHQSSTLVATCCGVAYVARPLNDSSRFDMVAFNVDMSNVAVLSAIRFF